MSLKRSTQHVTEQLVQESFGKDSEELLRVKNELESNKMALSQLERRLQRMRVALRHAPEGRVEVEVREEDLESLGSEFDSDAEEQLLWSFAYDHVDMM